MASQKYRAKGLKRKRHSVPLITRLSLKSLRTNQIVYNVTSICDRDIKMSGRTESAFVGTGEWSEHSRTHPAMKWMEDCKFDPGILDVAFPGKFETLCRYIFLIAGVFWVLSNTTSDLPQTPTSLIRVTGPTRRSGMLQTSPISDPMVL